MTENDDLRVRRTRKMIQEAVMALTVEQGFAAVTVSDICERAMINRSTFYRHFLDKYSVLEVYLDEFNRTMSEAHHAHMNGTSTTALPAGLLAFLGNIQAAGAFFRVMLSAQGDARFSQKFRLMLENHFRQMLVDEPSEPPADLRLSYVSGANVAAILWWLEHEPQRTVEEFAAWLGQITGSSLRLLHPGVQ